MSDNVLARVSVSELLVKDEAFFMGQTKEEVVGSLLQLIQHTKSITSVNSASAALSGKKRSSPEAGANVTLNAIPIASGPDVNASAQSLRKIIPKQIKAQMVWKTTCQKGKATWKYEGVCPSAEVFYALMKSNVSFKRKKIGTAELFELLECNWLTKCLHNCVLALGGDVSVTWNANTREYKFRGFYGK